MRILILLIFIGQFFTATAQVFRDVGAIEGQHWKAEVEDRFDRLPLRAKSQVTKAVWNLSKQSAGLMTRFRSNASEIIIRYQVRNEKYGMDHMQATGKSGVDLYAISSDGKELWCAAKRSFGDTIEYRYPNLNPNDGYHKLGREYRLYFPLYNSVEWMEIGVSEENYFEQLPVRSEKPIVIYGTSIAQGACASRPGMAWTAIVGRKMDRSLLNLGFSGNGLLAPEVIDLMTEIDAKIYVLDCLPNLLKARWKSMGIKDSIAFKEHIKKAVRQVKASKADTPILLVDHAGYTQDGIDMVRKQDYAELNVIQHQAYIDLKNEGMNGLYYLTKEEIGLSQDAMVDGTHPTDLGMNQYAIAYEIKLRAILDEEKGRLSTMQPTIQSREMGGYDWEKRHREILELNRDKPPKQVFLANSIIHFWGGEPRAATARDENAWKNVLTPAGLRNMAYGWDRIENVLWRVHHGELDDISPERVLVMIGTNNIHLNSNEDILEGLSVLMKAIKHRQPKAELVLMGLLPRRNYVDRISDLNMEIARLAANLGIQYDYLGDGLVDASGKLREDLFSDGLHPNEKGYNAMLPRLTKVVE